MDYGLKPQSCRPRRQRAWALLARGLGLAPLLSALALASSGSGLPGPHPARQGPIASPAPVAPQAAGRRRDLGSLHVLDKFPVAVTPEGDVGLYWRIASARFEEDLLGTRGVIHAKNVSGVTLRNPLFYAEYLDAGGRICFNLVLSAWQPGRQPGGPVRPGQSVRMFGFTFGLFPAVRPAKVGVILLTQGSPEPNYAAYGMGTSIRVPIFPLRGIPGPSGAPRLQLSETPSALGRPLADLLLAKVTVSATGAVSQISVLFQREPAVAAWFRGILQRLELYPAMRGEEREEGSTLILVRAITRDEGFGKSSSPRESPPLAALARHLRGPVLPQVLQILLARPPAVLRVAGPTGETKVIRRPPAPAGQFEVLTSVAPWVSPPLTAHADPTAPYGLALRLGPIGELEH